MKCACGASITDPIAVLFHKRCDDCGRKACAAGEHTWSPDAIGPGVFEASCRYCTATTNDGVEALKQLGFKPLPAGTVVTPTGGWPDDGEE